MAVCKYFQQGNCRFGQYCRFEHVNNFGNRNKPIYIDGNKSTALAVAEDILDAERGGQWILSCYGPFKEKPCIAGMEDVSPEEIRWNMYKAQADGTTDQVKLQFQQMCQEMKAKHDALKNPTPEIIIMLENLQKWEPDKSQFPFRSALTNATNSTFPASNSVFASNNTFGTNTFNSTSSNLFNNTGTNVFGSKPTFGGSSVFGGATAAPNSIFSNTAQLSQTTFGTPQTNQAFTSPSIFGAQSTFGQTPAFNTPATQPTNLFSQPAQTQSNVFSNNSATSTIFANSATPSGGIFSTANPSTPGSAIFGQAAAAPAFGQTSIFGNMGSNFATSAAPQIFGAQPTFNNPTAPAPTGNFMQPAAAAFNQNPQNQVGLFATTMAPPYGATFDKSNAPFSAPFASATTTAPTTTGPVFGVDPKSQSQPAFGNPNNVFANPSNAQSNVFGVSPFAINSTVTIVDDSMYTEESCLTEEEKNAFAAEQFMLLKTPYNPPTKELS